MIRHPLTQRTASFLAASSILALTGSSANVHEHNWPQWRGPLGNGIAPRANPPTEWSENKNIKWKTPVPGEGHATPAVWEDKVFVLTAVPIGEPAPSTEPAVRGRPPGQPPAGERGQGGRPPGQGFDREEMMRRFDRNGDGLLDDAERAALREQRGQRPGGPPGGPRGRRGPGGFGGDSAPTQEFEFVTLCLDRATGEFVWRKVGRKEKPHAGRQRTNTHASGSPLTDGHHVYSFFGSNGLYCYDLEGNLVWDEDLGDMRTRNGFGEGASPALYNDILLVLWDTEEDSFLYALDKKTGRQRWKKERDEPTGWTTPYVLTHKGKPQVVINGATAVRSYDPNTGALLWTCSGQTVNAIPTIVADATTAYAMSGYRGSAALAIELGHSGDLTNSDAIRWEISRGTPYVPSPLLYGDNLFFVQRNDGILTCVDATTGAPHYSQQRVEGLAGLYASPVGADNRVYFASQNGATVVIENSTELKVLATNQLDDPIDASPALAGDQLFLRTHTHLYCIAED